jgi:hypothetical protein
MLVEEDDQMDDNESVEKGSPDNEENVQEKTSKSRLQM